MGKNVIHRAENLNETIEFSLDRWPLLLVLIMLIWSGYSIIYPSGWFILFHWRAVSSATFAYFLLSVLWHSKWSPVYRGPTITLSPLGISGRAGWGNNEWKLAWDDLGHVARAYRGLVIFKKDMKGWDAPIVQAGPVDYSFNTIACCINARAKVYAESRR